MMKFGGSPHLREFGSRCESSWTLRINCEGGREIRQAEIGTSVGPLSTSGLFSCVALGVAAREKVSLAHVDAGCPAGILAHWIDRTFGVETPVTVHLWNHLGSDVPLFGHAARVVDQTLAYSKAQKQNIIQHGSCSLFEVVKVERESA